MMPPTPSMNKMPCRSLDRRAAETDQLVEVDAAAFARGGNIRRQRRAETPGRDMLDLVGRHGAAERVEQHRRIAGLDHGGIVAAHHRLERVHGLAGLAQIADQPGGDEGLADIGAGGGDEVSAHALVHQNLVAHDIGQPLDLLVRMLRGEGQPQPRGAGRHRGRADGGGEEALHRPAYARRRALLPPRRSPPARSGFAPRAGRRAW